MPSFSTYMKFAATLPSSPFGPARNTAAPAFSRLLSPGTGARIGTSGPMLYSDSPSLNLTCTTLPCGASVTVPTVALVITLSEPRSHANWRPPSGCACGKIRTSPRNGEGGMLRKSAVAAAVAMLFALPALAQNPPAAPPVRVRGTDVGQGFLDEALDPGRVRHRDLHVHSVQRLDGGWHPEGVWAAFIA